MIKKYLSVLTAVSLSLVAVTGAYSNAAEKDVTEVITKRSEYRKVFNNGDGTYTAYINTAPIHFLDNGEWTEIDNTLVDNGDGFYTNKNNSFSVSLPSELNIADAESSAVNLSYEKLNISCALTNIEIPSGFESQPAYIDVNNAVYDSAYDMNIPEGLAAAFSNASAEADYRSISDGLDLNMSVHNSTFTESLVINDVDKIPESVTYSVSAEGVQLERAEDNSLLFVRDGEIVLEIPMFVMCDSSEELNEFIVNYDIFETETGYDVVLYPLSSVGDVGSVAVPMSLGVYFLYDIDCNSCYNYQNDVNAVYEDNYLKMGNEYMSMVSIDDDFTMYSKYASIISAKFNVFIRSMSLTNPLNLNVLLNNEQVTNYNWASNHILSSHPKISETAIRQEDNLEWVEFDVTKMARLYLNYVNTNCLVGHNNYGIRIVNNNSSGRVTAYSERNSYNKPYFSMRFTINLDPYTVDSQEIFDKCNNLRVSLLTEIKNFQYRMNCYAYALQTYYNGSNTSYNLLPGEIGIGQNISNDHYLINNYTQLTNKYTTFKNDVSSCVSTLGSNSTAFRGLMGQYSDFIETQMYKDAQAMNFDITPITYSDLNNIDENNGRVIAMITYYKISSGSTTLDYHFYLRNGNGTCSNNCTNTKCSEWTQKNGLTEVRNKSRRTTSYILCDANIENYAYNLDTDTDLGANSTILHSNDIRYYYITKPTSLYTSCHGDHTYTGTPYFSN